MNERLVVNWLTIPKGRTVARIQVNERIEVFIHEDLHPAKTYGASQPSGDDVWKMRFWKFYVWKRICDRNGNVKKVAVIGGTETLGLALEMAARSI